MEKIFRGFFWCFLASLAFWLLIVLCVKLAFAHPVAHMRGNHDFPGDLQGAAKEKSAQYAPWKNVNLQRPDWRKAHENREHARRWMFVTSNVIHQLTGRLEVATVLCNTNQNCKSWLDKNYGGIKDYDDWGKKYNPFLTRDWNTILLIYYHIVPTNVVMQAAGFQKSCFASPDDRTQRPSWYPPVVTMDDKINCSEYFLAYGPEYIQAHADLALIHTKQRCEFWIKPMVYLLKEIENKTGTNFGPIDYDRVNLIGFNDGTVHNFCLTEFGVDVGL